MSTERRWARFCASAWDGACASFAPTFADESSLVSRESTPVTHCRVCHARERGHPVRPSVSRFPLARE
jgi:hypothetical protein